jgi:hypothetical protein
MTVLLIGLTTGGAAQSDPAGGAAGCMSAEPNLAG